MPSAPHPVDRAVPPPAGSPAAPPAAVTRAAVSRRAVTDTDRELLCAVYRSTRESELALVPWDEALKDAFVAQQFDAQDRSWAAQRPGTVREVVLVDGVPAGRLYVDHADDEVRVVDIALLPEHRGHGVGRTLLEQVLGDADRAGVPVTLHVERHNPAQRLYARLGFEVVDDGDVHLFLRRPPSGLGSRQPSPQAKTAS